MEGSGREEGYVWVMGNKKSAPEIEPWDDFNEVDLSEKRYVSDETRDKIRSSRILSNKEITERFKLVHGERYDYSKVEYVNSHTKVEVICPDHGSFFTLPSNHMRRVGSGCPRCGKTAGYRYTTEEIVRQFREVHGDRYDYSKVEYVNQKVKVKIVCKEHGVFLQLPDQHKGGSNCQKCPRVRQKRNADTKRKISVSNRLSKETVIKQFKDKHGDRYDYSKVKYVGGDTEVIVICPDHGEFLVNPRRHKAKGQGCPECGRSRRQKT